MDRWGQLNLQQKAQLLGIYASKGYTDLASIINHYNTFQAGGYIKKEDPVLKDRRPKANFYQRLLDANRQTIPDWEYKGNVATHKMSYATNEDNTKAVVYPEVQEINGKLYDFTDPKNKAGKWDALNRAIETGDTIQMTPTQANFWTQHYKEFYPSFNYAKGGSLGHITPYGQWQYPHQVTTIPSNNITMKGVDYPVLGISDTGDTKYMLPNMDYLFDGNYVTEYPLHKFQKGGYTTNGITLADGRTLYPISDLPAEDTPTSLPAAKINLKPVTVTAKHPLWDLPDYQGKEDNPNINAHKDELYQNRRRREEAGKEYLKNIGRVGLTMATLPILGYGATTAPLATGLSLAGGEGLNYGINKLTPYSSWGNMLAEDVFNTDNELAQTALEFTNPGFLLGPKAAPFVNNQYRGLRIANELRKGIRNTELQPRIAKNTAHTRTKLGDVEVDDPNLMYHVDNGDYTGFSGNGAYVKDGMLFPSQHSNGQKPYTWWNLGHPYRNGQTRLLTTTKNNPSLLRVRDQDYPIGQWTGNPKDRTFVTNSEYVSSKPIKIGNQYEYIPNYGYRRVQESIPTLEQAYQEALYEDATIASLNEEFGNRPIALTIPKIIRQAKSDLAAMNLYHDLNVAEYNAAMNSNIESIPFRTNIGQAKVMPKEDFIGLIKSMKMNTPDNNPNSVGGFYSYNDDMVYIPNIAHPSNVYHEYLHQGRYGVTNPEITRWRINQLVDKKTLESMKPEDRKYFMSEIEFPVHLRQQGEKYGIKVGEPYPGEEAFDKLIEEKGIGGAAYYVKRDTPEQKELFWKALNGTLFGSIPIGIGIGVSQSQSN